MNKEARKNERRRFNLLDVLIVVFVAGLIAGGWYMYNQYTENLQKNKEAIEYKVEIKGVDQKFVDAITKGDPLRESVKGNNLGYVEDVVYTPAVNINTDFLNGKYVAVAVPNKLDLVLTISSVAEVTDSSIAVGGLEIKIGQKLFVKGKGYANQGYILNIDIKE